MRGSPPRNLFVYGTLRAGFDNDFARLLSQQATVRGPGRVEGFLYQLGPYPGLILSPGSQQWVRGDLYRLHDPSRTLHVLDEYEGCGDNDRLPHEFERVEATVRLDSGRQARAWMYVYNHEVSERDRVASGDYLNP
jgi:gamma-glutamylcyclotransferase (GGCT)/AIG2-like uncharacterized protein YtfP